MSDLIAIAYPDVATAVVVEHRADGTPRDGANDVSRGPEAPGLPRPRTAAPSVIRLPARRREAL